jgi:hypothetical protein
MTRYQCMTSYGVVIAETSRNPIASDDTFSEPDKELKQRRPIARKCLGHSHIGGYTDDELPYR